LEQQCIEWRETHEDANRKHSETLKEVQTMHNEAVTVLKRRHQAELENLTKVLKGGKNGAIAELQRRHAREIQLIEEKLDAEKERHEKLIAKHRLSHKEKDDIHREAVELLSKRHLQEMHSLESKHRESLGNMHAKSDNSQQKSVARLVKQSEGREEIHRDEIRELHASHAKKLKQMEELVHMHESRVKSLLVNQGESAGKFKHEIAEIQDLHAKEVAELEKSIREHLDELNSWKTIAKKEKKVLKTFIEKDSGSSSESTFAAMLESEDPTVLAFILKEEDEVNDTSETDQGIQLSLLPQQLLNLTKNFFYKNGSGTRGVKAGALVFIVLLIALLWPVFFAMEAVHISSRHYIDRNLT
jgi:hypothetical protein